MSTVIILIVGFVVAWLGWSFSWIIKQSLVGTWVADLPDGAHVTLQFEGEPRGGIYKQLTKTGAVESKEFGHWTMNILALRLIIMATDVKGHPRFGVDTRYWVSFMGQDRITINGPDRSNWSFQRAAEGVKLDFEGPKGVT